MNSSGSNVFRECFPLLKEKVNGHDLVYFDNAATTQKPLQVISAYQSYYSRYNANVHRASHGLSAKSTYAFENVRDKVQTHIGAQFSHEIIWTKGTTESINLVANAWGNSNLSSGDEIVLSECEHHANIVPWQLLAERTGAIIKVLPLDDHGRIDTSALDTVVTYKTKLVSVAHISNVIGKVNPIKDIIARAKEVGAVSLIDGAQAIAHIDVDVQALDCDFYVFSAHKMYGPTGLGVLFGKSDVLNAMPPYQAGGEMISNVSFSGTTFNQLPFKFEAGTPNIAAVIALGEALDLFSTYSKESLTNEEHGLINYFDLKSKELAQYRAIVEGLPDIAVFAFSIDGLHNQDIASALDSYGIAVRSGHHCAMPLMEKLGINGCIRASLSPYNSIEEIDRFFFVLEQIVAEQIVAEENEEAIAGSGLPHDNSHIESPVKTAEYQARNESKEDTKKETEHEKNSAQALIVQTFSKASGWDQKHREIMLLGKAHARMDKALRSDETLIQGCESLAWLSVSQLDDGRFKFSADSDARIIRGLLSIVLLVLDQKTAQNILAFDIEGYFKDLGLMQHLSPSRGNGLKAIVNKIYQVVSQ